MPQDDNAKQVLRDWDKMQATRAQFDDTLQELKDLVRPNTASFNSKESPGQARNDKIFDGTAAKSAEELAGNLDANLTSPFARWFFVGLAMPYEDLLEDEDILVWLENVSDLIYSFYAQSEVGFNPAIHENYYDLVAFGTSVLYQDQIPGSQGINVRAFALGDCWIKENSQGRIDTVFRRVELTTRQCFQEFEVLPDKIETEKDMDKCWTFVHAVYPRMLRNYSKYDSRNMPFASCWVSKDLQLTLRESGYMENPYHVPRWTKNPGEIYGRSPGWTCLPNIRMLNMMAKTTIRAAQKVVDPPIVAEDDGVLLPLKTFPGATILKTPGAESPHALLTQGRVDIGLDMMNRERDFIARCFYIDLIKREQKKERQTTLEIQDSRDEMNRGMGPMLGRIQSELLGPMLMRTYNLLNRAGRIPLAPEKLRRAGARLKIQYISPGARAQMGSKIISLQQALNDIAGFAQVNPTILDVVDTDKAAQQIFTLRDVSRKVMRTPDEIAAIRQQRQQAQQIAQAAQVGGTAASGLKDLSTAQLNMAKAASGG